MVLKNVRDNGGRNVALRGDRGDDDGVLDRHVGEWELRGRRLLDVVAEELDRIDALQSSIALPRVGEKTDPY